VWIFLKKVSKFFKKFLILRFDGFCGYNLAVFVHIDCGFSQNKANRRKKRKPGQVRQLIDAKTKELRWSPVLSA
jgi:hypothetical protein